MTPALPTPPPINVAGFVDINATVTTTAYNNLLMMCAQEGLDRHQIISQLLEGIGDRYRKQLMEGQS